MSRKIQLGALEYDPDNKYESGWTPPGWQVAESVPYGTHAYGSFNTELTRPRELRAFSRALLDAIAQDSIRNSDDIPYHIDPGPVLSNLQALVSHMAEVWLGDATDAPTLPSQPDECLWIHVLQQANQQIIKWCKTVEKRLRLELRLTVSRFFVSQTLYIDVTEKQAALIGKLLAADERKLEVKALVDSCSSFDSEKSVHDTKRALVKRLEARPEKLFKSVAQHLGNRRYSYVSLPLDI